MSGQTGVGEQQSYIDITKDEFIREAKNIQDQTISDPVAAFLEKHGYKFTTDHQGNRVTYNEAVIGCPALPELIRAMGDGALALTAARHTGENDNKKEEQQPEAEAEETQEQAAEEQPESNTAREGASPKHAAEVQKVVTKDNLTTSRSNLREAAKQGGLLQTEIENFENIESNNLSDSQAPTDQSRGGKLAAHTQAENSPSTASTAITAETSGSGINTSQAAIEIENVKIKEREGAISEQEAKITSAEIKYLPTEDITEGQASETSVKLDELIQEIIGKEELETSQSLQEETSEAVLEDGEADLELDIAELTETADDNPTFEIPVIKTDRPSPDDIELNELSASAEEVEQIMLSVDERLRELADENTEQAEQATVESSEILDEIMALIEQKDASGQEIDAMEVSAISDDSLETEEKEAKLKELFAELFEKLEIDYTPEQLDACVKFALRGGMEEVLSSDKENEEEALVPGDTGTHEVLKQILSAVAYVKRSLAHAYAIGKTALHLYVQKLDLPRTLLIDINGHTI